jgi:hypothetical protein
MLYRYQSPALDPGGPEGFSFGIHRRQSVGRDDLAAIPSPSGIEF